MNSAALPQAGPVFFRRLRRFEQPAAGRFGNFPSDFLVPVRCLLLLAIRRKAGSGSWAGGSDIGADRFHVIAHDLSLKPAMPQGLTRRIAVFLLREAIAVFMVGADKSNAGG